MDAAHANNVKTPRSTTGASIYLGGTSIHYLTKTQGTMAPSSTKAEFISAVFIAKTVKYLRMILKELGYIQHDPTVIYEDNAAAILMANAEKPTIPTRHMEIQYCALQEWVKRKEVVLKYIPTTINCSDVMTKVLGWVLHRRHVGRIMGWFGSPYSDTYGKIQ